MNELTASRVQLRNQISSPMRIRFTITVDIDSFDVVGLELEKRSIGSWFDKIRADFGSAALSVKQRKPRKARKTMNRSPQLPVYEDY